MSCLENSKGNKTLSILLLMILFYSCGIKKEKIYGTYKTHKKNVRQLTLNLKSDYTYDLLLEASMTYDSIYGKYLIKGNEIILLINRKEDILHKVFSDSVKVSLLNQRKLQILKETLKKE
ncbi:hypothetical protein [Psychroserpens ponticola]|uniref:DUF4296 domain-containing protein n=1 Tax=Psychroserpens ponticola TaxID=2932268 RepID=A0ABY7RU15_9FLAO|nr:hypothetical protein [Psychroserpens ponticola]WCO00272.1 hypothetical protein MUN68_009320 [Psychroserpens ponticola]